MSLSETIPFGTLLKQLRKRAGMTQGDLAAALDYSDGQISRLEKAQRLPDLEAVISRFVPALGLQNDPASAALLIERAAAARGERPAGIPMGPVTLQRVSQVVIQGALAEQPVQLPSSPSELIGRSKEVNQICNRMLGHSGRLLTLLGPPGIGKTQLALAIASRLQHHYTNGAVFVALAELIDPVLVASAILDAVGGNNASARPPKIKLIESLRRKTMLLVLDNCDQIRDAAPLVAELLEACGGLVILATSRERLHLRAEQRHHVPPLELGAAVELFTRRARAVDARFVLTEANRPIIEAICRRLDYLPLALELCAAQTDLLSLPQLLAQLHNRRLDLLVDGAHDLPPRQRSLRRAIQASYALLTEEERTLFRCLGVFAGGFDLESLVMVGVSSPEVAIGGDAVGLQSTLHTLIGKSLVHVESTASGEQRFLLLETLREFALEQLQAHGEEAEARQRHFAAYLQLVRTVDSKLRGPEAATWFARMDPEQDNLRAALHWVFDEKCYEDAAWLMVAILWIWHRHGNWHEYGRWLARLLPFRHMLNLNLRLATLVNVYSVLRALEELQPVDRWTGEVMQLLEHCSDKLIHAAVWHFIAWHSTDFPVAATAWERSIELARFAGEAPGLGAEFGPVTDRNHVLGTSIRAYATRLLEYGEFERAATLSLESFKLFRARGNRYETADSLGNLGHLALLQGDLVQAHSLLHEAVTLATALNYREMLCRWQPLLGLVTLYEGDVVEAYRLLNESLRFCTDLNAKDFLGRNCLYLSEVALWTGDKEQAAQWLAQTLDYQADGGAITIFEVRRLLLYACLATAQQQYSRAATLFGLADQAHSHIHYVLFSGPMRTQVDTALATLREALGTELFEEAFTAGQRMSLDEASATMLVPART